MAVEVAFLEPLQTLLKRSCQFDQVIIRSPLAIEESIDAGPSAQLMTQKQIADLCFPEVRFDGTPTKFDSSRSGLAPDIDDPADLIAT